MYEFVIISPHSLVSALLVQFVEGLPEFMCQLQIRGVHNVDVAHQATYLLLQTLDFNIVSLHHLINLLPGLLLLIVMVYGALEVDLIKRNLILFLKDLRLQL